MIKRLPFISVLLFSVFLVVAVNPCISGAAQQKGKTAPSQTPSKSMVSQQANLQKINVNKAGVEELVKVPGIGPKTAEAILKYRESNGPFKDTADLVHVKGIGAAKLEKIQPYVTVE